jgi:putative endonuclease
MTIVYVFQSESEPEHYYIGTTDDLPRRIKEHDSAAYGHTLKHRPWRLNVAIQFSDPMKAEAFETHLKSGSGRSFARRHF